jgi:hypothetical protein
MLTQFNIFFETSLRAQASASRYGKLLENDQRNRQNAESYRQAEYFAKAFLKFLQDLSQSVEDVLVLPTETWTTAQLEAMIGCTEFLTDHLTPIINTIAASPNDILITVHGQGLASEMSEAAQAWNELAWMLEQNVERERFKRGDGYDEMVKLINQASVLTADLPAGFVLEFEEVTLGNIRT